MALGDEVHQIRYAWSEDNGLNGVDGFVPVAASVRGRELSRWNALLDRSVQVVDRPRWRHPPRALCYLADDDDGWAAIVHRERSPRIADTRQASTAHVLIGPAETLTPWLALSLHGWTWADAHAEAPGDARLPAVNMADLQDAATAGERELIARLPDLSIPLVRLLAGLLAPGMSDAGSTDESLLVTGANEPAAVGLMWGAIEALDLAFAGPWTFSSYEIDGQVGGHMARFVFVPTAPIARSGMVMRSRMISLLDDPAPSVALDAAAMLVEAAVGDDAAMLLRRTLVRAGTFDGADPDAWCRRLLGLPSRHSSPGASPEESEPVAKSILDETVAADETLESSTAHAGTRREDSWLEPRRAPDVAVPSQQAATPPAAERPAVAGDAKDPRDVQEDARAASRALRLQAVKIVKRTTARIDALAEPDPAEIINILVDAIRDSVWLSEEKVSRLRHVALLTQGRPQPATTYMVGRPVELPPSDLEERAVEVLRAEARRALTRVAKDLLRSGTPKIIEVVYGLVATLQLVGHVPNEPAMGELFSVVRTRVMSIRQPSGPDPPKLDLRPLGRSDPPPANARAESSDSVSPADSTGPMPRIHRRSDDTSAHSAIDQQFHGDRPISGGLASAQPLPDDPYHRAQATPHLGIDDEWPRVMSAVFPLIILLIAILMVCARCLG